MTFGVEKKLKWCGYPMLKIFEDIFIRFDRIYERGRHPDRRTNGQTDTARRNVLRLHSIARKNYWKTAMS